MIFPPSGVGTLYQLGPYQCSDALDLSFLVSVLAEYLESTMTTLAATTTFLTLNLHAAAPASDPDGPAVAPDDADLPSPNSLISNLLNTNLSSYLYTPTRLLSDRSDLNSTWYNAALQNQPYSRYYDTATGERDIYTTPDGWPSESYVEFSRQLRLLADFGNVDPQLSNYNFDGDARTIFPSNYLRNVHAVSYASDGTISEGCFVDFDRTDIAASNNSWAESVVDVSTLSLASNANSSVTSTSISNLTECGSSPFLNDTLLNTTADRDFYPYRTIPYSTIWSWARGEPRNVSEDEENAERRRCAVIDLSLRGRWRVVDCTDHHYSACRVGGEPYRWAISDQKGSYSFSAVSGCSDGQAFSVPRTGLENMHLVNHYRDVHDDEDSDTALWIDFNSLDRRDCWVAGVNTTCPYEPGNDDDRSRTVIVPTVAAVIVFVVAALMILVKCAANRQSSRRRRRRKGEDGWDYEGVPS